MPPNVKVPESIVPVDIMVTKASSMPCNSCLFKGCIYIYIVEIGDLLEVGEMFIFTLSLSKGHHDGVNLDG